MQVAFMEPNGLRHRECKIHNTNAAITDKEDVIGVAFNLEGDLLSVTSMVTTGDTASNQQYQYGKVQFYHSSNYHWYLKYELRYNGNARTGPSVVTNTKFSEEDPYQILIALKQKKDGALEWREYTFRWEASTIHYCDNNWLPTSSSVLAMSIDGKTLNFTALDKAIIPPPMYASSLELPAPAVGIATRPCFYNEVVNESKRADVIIALSDGRLALLQYGGGEGGNSKPSITPGFQPPLLLAVIDPFSIISSDESDDSGLHLQGTVLRDISVINAMDDSLTVVALTSSQGTSGEGHHFDILFEVKISWIAQSETPKIMIVSSLSLEGRALRVVSWSDTIISPGARGSALVELIDGSLLKYSQGGILEPCGAGPLLEPCPWIAGIYDAHKASTTSSAASKDTPPVDDETSEHLVIGLSSRYRLYSGERLLSNASSSFVISLQHKFLSHVTIGSQPQLKFLPLAALCDFDPLQGSDDQNAMLDGYEPRSVERGARLVAFFQTLPIIVLQMPRGNLEGITPRACLLPYIMLKILKGDFLTALDIMRRQRVDLNLIVDIDPHSFLEKGGAEQFVGQIEKIDNVNLFLSSLIDVDTTLWKYPVPPWIHDEMGSSSTLRQFTAGKVNAVCQKMRNVLLDAEKNGKTSIGKDIKKGHFLLPILSTFAKENPPKLEEALELIKNHASSDSSKARVVHKSKKFDEAIAYLAYLADYELIFNTAIGMYDFDLAKAVARHSQMDPKVYLPLLKHWRELPEAIARYEVDVKLKRYESALRHLVASKEVKEEPPDEDEVYVANCLKFIEEQNLYSLGLELFRNEKNIYRSIMVSLGERLLVDKKPRDALTIFLTANPSYLDGGKRASLACNDWRTFFACCAENEESVGVDQATAIAESISSQVGNLRDQRENFASAATILLEYAVDVSYAIDMLISAHLWSEGRRVAYLCKRLDLVRKVVDGSYTYARTCIEDLGERASLFVKANDRYYEVIVIRREAIGQSEEMNDIHLDDSESVFSMQSTSSITSLRSIASGTSIGSVGSVGTAASVSTVISVGAASSFSFTGEVDAMKHKSKFNRLGRDSKKKKRPKKKGPAARRIKPGSEEELRELVATLNHACPDDDYIDVICETITFLLESEKHAMAKLLFESYKDIESAIAQSQNARLMQDMKTRTHLEQKEREGGYKSNFTQHPCEQDIDTLVCKPLQDSIQNVMSKLSL
jgi:elongator complex protein 1